MSQNAVISAFLNAGRGRIWAVTQEKVRRKYLTKYQA